MLNDNLAKLIEFEKYVASFKVLIDAADYQISIDANNGQVNVLIENVYCYLLSDIKRDAIEKKVTSLNFDDFIIENCNRSANFYDISFCYSIA